MTLKRRICRLEASAYDLELRRECHRIAAEHGLDPVEVMNQARLVFQEIAELWHNGLTEAQAHRAWAERQGMDADWVEREVRRMTRS